MIDLPKGNPSDWAPSPSVCATFPLSYYLNHLSHFFTLSTSIQTCSTFYILGEEAMDKGEVIGKAYGNVP